MLYVIESIIWCIDAHRHKRQAIQRCSVDSSTDKQTGGNSQAGRQDHVGGRMNVILEVYS